MSIFQLPATILIILIIGFFPQTTMATFQQQIAEKQKILQALKEELARRTSTPKKQRSLNDLLVILTNDIGQYTGGESVFGAHIPSDHPKNFDTKKRSIILLSTKNNPAMMNFTYKKELGHFILQDVPPEEITKRFGYQGDYKTIGQQMVLKEWSNWLKGPTFVKPEQNTFFQEQLKGVGTGTPEVIFDKNLK